MAHPKIKLILELKNKVKTGLSKAKEKINSNVSDMKKKLSSLKDHHVKMFSQMRQEIPLLDKGLSLLANRYVLLAGGLVSLGILFGKATSKAADFNAEFLHIKNLNLDKSQEELKKYKNTILDTALALGTEVKATSKAFYDVQSATGKYGDDAKQIVASVGKFSIAVGADLGDTVNSTTKAMKAFKLEVGDIDAYLESNAKTVQVGITTFQELARVQTEYAGAAAGAGQDVNTANKIFAAFTSIAKDSNTAATMTKSAFEGLTQKQTIAGLKDIGISMYDAKGNMRDLSMVLKEVSGKFKTMSPKAIDETINKIGGPEGLRNLFVKLKIGASDFFNTLEAFDSSKFNIDAALSNAMGDFNKLKELGINRFNTVLTNLGTSVLPPLVKILNQFNNAILWAKKNSKLLKSVLVGLIASYTAYKAVLLSVNLIQKAKTILKSVKAFIMLTKAIRTARNAQLIFNLAAKASPLGLITTLIGGAITAFTIFSKKQKEVSKFHLQAQENIKKETSELNNLFKVINSNKAGSDNRNKALKTLLDKYQKYLPKLTKEKDVLKDIASYQKTISDNIYKQNILKARDNEIKELSKERDEYKASIITELRSYLDDQKGEAKGQIRANFEKHINRYLDTFYKNNRDRLKTSKDMSVHKLEDIFSDAGVNIPRKGLGYFSYKINRLAFKDSDLRDSIKNINKEYETYLNTLGIKSSTNANSLPNNENALTESTTTNPISNIVGSAKQVKNIQISIDAIHKGDLVANSEESQEMTVEEMGDKLNELILRTIRNIELSY
ncbi:MAG: phage tail tape measure protein [Marinifilaceae bacterium]|jgi:TP901 family phage tail tape measure protein|nr:phage tail tape measure protein [Marinifilaceae bacterium]